MKIKEEKKIKVTGCLVFLPRVKNFRTNRKGAVKSSLCLSFVQKTSTHITHPSDKADSNFWVSLGIIEKPKL